MTQWPEGYFSCITHRCTLSPDACAKRHVSAVEGGHVAQQRTNTLALYAACRECELGAELSGVPAATPHRVLRTQAGPELGDMFGLYMVVGPTYRASPTARHYNVMVECQGCGVVKGIQMAQLRNQRRGCAACARRPKVARTPKAPRKPLEELPASRRQSDVLRVLRDSLEKDGRTPTFREIADELGLAAVKTIARHMDLLERKGYISRGPRRLRKVRDVTILRSTIEREGTV